MDRKRAIADHAALRVEAGTGCRREVVALMPENGTVQPTALAPARPPEICDARGRRA